MTTCIRCIARVLPAVYVAVSTLLAPSAQAAVVSTAGSVQQLASPPSTVMPNAFQDDNTIWIFKEKTAYTLSAPLTININAPGFYNTYPASLTSTLPAGLTVDVYFMHFDPRSSVRHSGSVTFDVPILGVIVRDAQLFASNYLGVPTTTYPNSGTNRALENIQDRITLSPDMKTITVDWLASSPGDRIRIITASPSTSAIPEPTSLALFGAGLMATGVGLRRTRRGQRILSA
ncbi:MAG: PEP-CTERM sorting domain-containing protein [bacterium]|nr:PEP-CTERM sorting domain-containing protein [bacterium]